MLYVMGDVFGSGPWSRLARRYCLGLVAAGVEFRLAPRIDRLKAPVAFEAAENAPGYAGVFERLTGGVSGKCDALLIIGPFFDAAQIVSNPNERPAKCVAVTCADTDDVKKYFIKAMEKFLGVITPTEATAAVLRKNGLERVAHVPPAPPPEDPSRPWRPAHEEASLSTTYCVAGKWNLGVRDRLELFAQGRAGLDDVELLVLCPDVVPEEIPEEILSDVLVNPQGLEEGEAWLAETLADVDLYLPVRQPGGIDFVEVEAAAAGALGDDLMHSAAGAGEALRDKLIEWGLIDAPSRGSILDDPPRIAFVVPHKDRGCAWLGATLDSILPQLGKRHRVVVVDEESSPEVREAVERLCSSLGVPLISCADPEGVWNLSLARNAGARWALSGVLWKPTHVMPIDCDVVLPQGYVERLEKALSGHPKRAVVPVISQGSLPPEWTGPDEGVQEPKGKVGLTARLLGFLGIGGGASAIDPLKMPAEALEVPDLAKLLDRREARRATGLACVPLVAVEALHGWDEAYRGWGDEDVDFLWRFREEWKGEIYQWEEPPWPYHRPHARSPHMKDWALLNNARVAQRMSGTLPQANGDGEAWGKYEEVLG